MDSIDIVERPTYDTYAVVGDIDYIGYTTVRDGVTESYHHDFKHRSRPQLAISHDGQQIQPIGGSYLFTESGINDI